jgi:hypothetical protein|tara:strand:+ start:74 stop:334 length:261 start_codon:yes stop_codon:yes gene_type:complete
MNSFKQNLNIETDLALSDFKNFLSNLIKENQTLKNNIDNDREQFFADGENYDYLYSLINGSNLLLTELKEIIRTLENSYDDLLDIV